MKRMLFRVSLQHLHRASGVTRYRIAKDLGLSHNTVSRYVSPEHLYIERIERIVPQLAAYFGRDWRDHDIVDWVEVDDETLNKN